MEQRVAIRGIFLRQPAIRAPPIRAHIRPRPHRRHTPVPITPDRHRGRLLAHRLSSIANARQFPERIVRTNRSNSSNSASERRGTASSISASVLMARKVARSIQAQQDCAALSEILEPTPSPLAFRIKAVADCVSAECGDEDVTRVQTLVALERDRGIRARAGDCDAEPDEEGDGFFFTSVQSCTPSSVD